MFREMTFARYTQLAMLLMAVALCAVNPSLKQTILVVGVLMGMLVGSSVTSGSMSGIVAGTVAGAAVSLYLIGHMVS